MVSEILRAKGPRASQAIVLIPDGNGGIRRLFDQIRDHSIGYDLHWTEFASTPSSKWDIAGFVRKIILFRRMVRKGEFDLAHLNVSTGGSTYRKFAYAFLCARAGIPYVLHLHGGRYPAFLSRANFVKRRMIQTFFKRASGVIVLGEFWARFVENSLSVEPGRVAVVPNAVAGPSREPLTRPLSQETTKLVFVGRVSEEKGVNDLLSALCRPDVMALPWTLELAGDGEVEAFRARASSLGLGDRVTFRGWLGSHDLDALLAESDVFILVSHVENLPLSLLEAMGHGLFSIVTDVGATSEVVTNLENGVLLPVKNIDALADILLVALTDKELVTQVARQGRADFKRNYDVEDYPERLVEAYKSFGVWPR